MSASFRVVPPNFGFLREGVVSAVNLPACRRNASHAVLCHTAAAAAAVLLIASPSISFSNIKKLNDASSSLTSTGPSLFLDHSMLKPFSTSTLPPNPAAACSRAKQCPHLRGVNRDGEEIGEAST